MAESTKNMTVGAGSASASVTATVTDRMPGVPCPASPGYEYTGMRYVPVFADPPEWSSANSYEPLEIVIHEGNSYTSKTFVPVGIDIANSQYWVLTGNYDAQVEQYRQEVAKLSGAVGELEKSVSYLDNFNVPEQFGAVGNGIADDTAAIRSWLQSGESLALKPGKTYLTDSITVSSAVKVILGFNATLKFNPDQANACVVIDSARCDIQGITIDCNGNGIGVTSQATRCTISKSQILNFTRIGLQTLTGTTSGYEAVFDTLYIVAADKADYGVYVKRADCIFNNVVTQDCMTAFRFDQGSALISNLHSWNRAVHATEGSVMFSIFTPDVILANNVYCDTVKYLINVPTTVTPTATITAKNVLMLAPEGFDQFICKTYSGATNTYGVHVQYNNFPGRNPKTYNVNTFQGIAESMIRVADGSEVLGPTYTSMRNTIGWGFKPGLSNTPKTGMSVYRQLLNIGYIGYFDLTSTTEITPSAGYVAIGNMPPVSSTETGLRTVGFCKVGNEMRVIAFDYSDKTVKVEASANIPANTRIAGNVFFSMY